MTLSVLQRGSCEPLKAAIHGTALGLFAVMGLYNAAAWLMRRQPHLAVNAALYSTLTVWERRHVTNHLAELHACRQRRVPPLTDDAPSEASAIPAKAAA
jgi:hypothetical protein